MIELILATECRYCGGLVNYIESPSGGWWRHSNHPSDNHEAEINERAQEELEVLLNLRQE